jgi:hypothetical protein
MALGVIALHLIVFCVPEAICAVVLAVRARRERRSAGYWRAAQATALGAAALRIGIALASRGAGTELLPRMWAMLVNVPLAVSTVLVIVFAIATASSRVRVPDAWNGAFLGMLASFPIQTLVTLALLCVR